MLASEKKAHVTLVHVVEVPKELPLDALFPAEEQESRTILNHATSVLDRYGVRAHARTIHATTAANAILKVADDTDAQIIVIGTEPRERRHRVAVGRNVEHVLKRASCRVMMVTARPTRDSSISRAIPGGLAMRAISSSGPGWPSATGRATLARSLRH